MGLVVELSFDAEGEEAVRSIWRALAAAQVTDSMLEKPYCPHVSLGLLREGQADAAATCLSAFAAQQEPLSLHLPYYGIFNAPYGIVFLGVTLSEDISQVHHSFYERCAAVVDTGTLFVPDAWVPHCTLAYGLEGPALGRAIDICRQFPLPLTLHVDQLVLVESDNGDVLQSYAWGR